MINHKAPLSAAAAIVIATCGYLIYEDIRTKRIMKERFDYRRCTDSLELSKEILESYGARGGTTIEQKVEQLRNVAGDLVADIFEEEWKKCGPI